MAADSRSRPRLTEHWALLVLVLITVGFALLLQGYAHGDVGHGATAPADERSAVVPEMKHAGPILDFNGREVRSTTPPARTIALTFDDGPDGRWTPRILDVLARYHVPATFF